MRSSYTSLDERASAVVGLSDNEDEEEEEEEEEEEGAETEALPLLDAAAASAAPTRATRADTLAEASRLPLVLVTSPDTAPLPLVDFD